MRPIGRLMLGISLLLLYALVTGVLFDLWGTPFDSDEATHALAGMEIASDLYHGNVGLLLRHIYFRNWYPPLLPVYLAPFVLVLGPAYWSMRYPVVLLVVVFLALLYRAAVLASQDSTAGLIAVILTATSPLLWVHAAMVMEELLALIGVSLVIITYLRMKRHHGLPVWLGVSMAFTLMAKLSIGIPVVGAVLLSLLSAPEVFNTKLTRIGRVFVPLGVFVLLWWGHPVKIRDTIDYVRASPPAYQSIGWSEVTYYWRAFLTNYRVMPLFGVLTWVSIATAFLRWKEVGWRLPLCLVLAKWLVLLLERQINARFFVDAAAVASLLTANWLVTYVPKFWERIRNRATKLASLALIALILAIGSVYLVARVLTFPFLMEVAYETDPEAIDIYAWIAERIEYDRPIFFINGWDQFSTDAFDFYLGARTWPRWETTQAVDVLLENPEVNPAAVEWFYEALATASTSYLVHLENTPVPNAGAWWAYRPALENCRDEDWNHRQTFQIALWDGRLEGEILRHSFKYARRGNRLAAREAFRYPLLMKVKVSRCQ